MNTLHLVIGPVGAGKSTFARQRALQTGAVFLDLDHWMVRLFGKDTRPEENVLDWYLERRERCRALLWDLALDILAASTDVYLELGLVAARERETYYARARAEDLRVTVYLLDAPRDLRRERVAERNRAAGDNTQVVPLHFFELASDAWQPPSEMEREQVSIVEL